MEELVDSVKEHNIRGVHLPNLAKEDLIELGAVKLGQRMTIDDEINKLVNPVIDEIWIVISIPRKMEKISNI